ncbi:MAG: hypothetical protein V3V62_09835 [bacterium]
MAQGDATAAARRCNLCGGRNFRLLFEKEGYSILRCLGCRLVFTEPIPPEDELSAIYGRALRRLYGGASTAVERGPSVYLNAFDIVTVLARRNGEGAA